MNQELQDMIREARRNLRRASGISLSSEEQAEEQRTLEIARMEKFIHEALGIRIMFSLTPKVVWTENGATAQFSVGDHNFQLYKDGKSYRLSDTEGDRPCELLNISGSDPNFSNRVLVAVGDAFTP